MQGSSVDRVTLSPRLHIREVQLEGRGNGDVRSIPIYGNDKLQHVVLSSPCLLEEIVEGVLGQLDEEEVVTHR